MKLNIRSLLLLSLCIVLGLSKRMKNRIGCVNPETRALADTLKSKGVLKSPIVEEAFCSVDRGDFEMLDPYGMEPESKLFGRKPLPPDQQVRGLEEFYNKFQKSLSPCEKSFKILDIASGNGIM